MATRSVSPEKHDQTQDAPATSEGTSGYQSGHPGSHSSAEHQQHQYPIDASESGRKRIRSGPSHASSEPDRKRIRSGPSSQLPDAQPSGLSSHSSRQPTDARPSLVASSPPEPSQHVPVIPRIPASYAPQAPPNQPSALAQPDSHQPINHVRPNPPTNVLAILQGFIPLINQGTVRDYLTIAAIRHKDIYDMVIGECERIVKEHQAQKDEDASVLSFAKEYTMVQWVLYQDYDNLPEFAKPGIFNQTLGTINQNIMAIPPRVRLGSNWQTKFNALRALIWIGTAMVDGRGMLPNAIRAQMANGSELAKAIDHVSAIMGEAEVLNDAARLLKILVPLKNSREHCFKGLERLADMFRKVMQQGSVG